MHLSNFLWFSFLKLSTRLLIWRQWVTRATLSVGHYLNLLIRRWIVDDFSLAKLPCSVHTLILILFSKRDKPNLNFIDSGNQIKYHEGLQINCPQAPGNECVTILYGYFHYNRNIRNQIRNVNVGKLKNFGFSEKYSVISVQFTKVTT